MLVKLDGVAVSCGFDTMICGQTCDGLYHFAFLLGQLGIPYGSHTIKPALARHTGVQVPVVPAKVIT